jgi:hypothetical protein
MEEIRIYQIIEKLLEYPRGETGKSVKMNSLKITTIIDRL